MRPFYGALYLLVLITVTLQTNASAKQRICGKKLLLMLKKVCTMADGSTCFKGNFVQPTKKDTGLKQRQSLMFMMKKEIYDLEKDLKNLKITQVPKPKKNSPVWLVVPDQSNTTTIPMPRLRRDGTTTDGVATECCTKKCSYSYLKSYCCDSA